jgi:hypothetical protein
VNFTSAAGGDTHDADTALFDPFFEPAVERRGGFEAIAGFFGRVRVGFVGIANVAPDPAMAVSGRRQC